MTTELSVIPEEDTETWWCFVSLRSRYFKTDHNFVLLSTFTFFNFNCYLKGKKVFQRIHCTGWPEHTNCQYNVLVKYIQINCWCRSSQCPNKILHFLIVAGIRLWGGSSQWHHLVVVIQSVQSPPTPVLLRFQWHALVKLNILPFAGFLPRCMNGRLHLKHSLPNQSWAVQSTKHCQSAPQQAAEVVLSNSRMKAWLRLKSDTDETWLVTCVT